MYLISTKMVWATVRAIFSQAPLDTLLSIQLLELQVVKVDHVPQVSGGVAEANGKLLRGDQIMAVNEKDLSQAVQDQVQSPVLKT
jgi:hypothetical protein